MTPLKKGKCNKLTYLILENLIIIPLLIFTVLGAVALAVVPVTTGRCEAVTLFVDRCGVASSARVSTTPRSITVVDSIRL